MSAHAITLRLPEDLYERFRRRAEWTHRSLEAEVLDVVAAATSFETEIAPELMQAIDALEEASDEELWRLAREAMSPQQSAELEALHAKQRDESLSWDEDSRRVELLQQYERTMLIRAQASGLLKERGHDISGLLGIP